MESYAQKQRNFRYLIKEKFLTYEPPKNETEYIHIFSILGIIMYIISLIIYK